MRTADLACEVVSSFFDKVSLTRVNGSIQPIAVSMQWVQIGGDAAAQHLPSGLVVRPAASFGDCQSCSFAR
jgi:hypothetical protein